MKAASTEDIFGARTYEYPPTGELFTSVTTILDATQGKPQLVPWAARVAAEYAIANLDRLAGMVAASPEGAADAVKLVQKEAQRIRAIKADAGSYVHAVAEALTLWGAAGETGAGVSFPSLDDERYQHLIDAEYDGDPVPQVVDMMIDGFMRFVDRYKPEFLATEMSVFHPGLQAAGTLDAIILLRDVDVETIVLPDGRRRARLIACPGNILIICLDIKTGRWLEATVYEQLAAYRRFPKALVGLGELVDVPTTHYSAVLHCRPAYRNGYSLRIFPREDDTLAWNRFRRAVEIFHGRKPYAGKLAGSAVHLPRPDGTPEPMWWDELREEGYAGLAKLLLGAGQFTTADTAARTAADLLAIKNIGPARLNTIRTVLAAEGLHLADETPDIQLGEVA